MTLSIISLVVAIIALTVNVSSLVRRPRIIAEWGWVQEDHGPGVEGLTIIATARRRPIEVDELGIVLLPRRTWRRRLPEWLHAERPLRMTVRPGVAVPRRLQDGESIRGFAENDHAADELGNRDGIAYTYVLASGTAYLARDSSVQKWLRDRRRVGERD